MPTTTNEAEIITNIFKKWCTLDRDTYGSMFKEMFEEVGLITDNYSVRQSLLMILKIFVPEYKIPIKDVRRLLDEWCSNKTVQTVTQREYIGLTHNEYVDFMDGSYSDGVDSLDSSST